MILIKSLVISDLIKGIWKDPLKIEYRGVEMVVDWNSEIVLINIGNGNVMEFKVGGSIQVKKLDDCCKEYFNEVK